MIKINKREQHPPYRTGQSAVEYILLFAVIVIVLVVAMGPQGFLMDAVNKSLNLAFNAFETMANEACYNPPCS